MEKNKPIDNNPKLQESNSNPIEKLILEQKTDNSQQIITGEENATKDNIQQNLFTGITPDMITVMPKNNPNIIQEKEPPNDNELNNNKDNNINK